MKSEHRHELKTNELSQWLSNLPQWTRENLITVLLVVAVIVAAAAFLFYRTYSRNVVQVRRHLEFTNLLNQLSAIEAQIPGAQAEGRDLSFTLIPAADSLGTFAQNTKDDRMAALGFIEQAEALRTELLYRPGPVSKEDLTNRINRAKTAYTQALQRSSDPALKAAAELGIGLCEEELANFEEAAKIYRRIAENEDYNGTVAKASARFRLETMDNYKQTAVFKPSPPAPAASAPPDITPAPDANQQSQTPATVPDADSNAPEPNVSDE
jgi:tetratricopeptide (TPR) repeat protein